MANKKYIWLMIVIFLLGFGASAGYFYFSKKTARQPAAVLEVKTPEAVLPDDAVTLRIYYPVSGTLQMEERKVRRRMERMSVAEAVIGEFLKGPVNVKVPEVPRDTKLLGLYRGEDGILYVNFSDEFRMNFNGDAASEFLLLKGLFESLISNVQEITDVKVLIEGKEMESLGGHVYLLYPLKDNLSSEVPDPKAQTGGTGAGAQR